MSIQFISVNIVIEEIEIKTEIFKNTILFLFTLLIEVY